MAATEHPLSALKSYIPEISFDRIAALLQQYKVHLTITKERRSVLGDYRNAVHGKNHRISINGSLNPYSFLLTLVHELAHLLTYEKFGNRISPHGKEWKGIYSFLLKDFLEMFPADVQRAIQSSLHNPAASSCAEEEVMRALKNYDAGKKGLKFLEQLEKGDLFKTHDGRIFKKGEKLRKRYRCVEIATKYAYLFSGIYEVDPVINIS